MPEIPSTVIDLQAQWHVLIDLDRAKAIRNVIQSSNISQRKLAAALNCSEALLRHLLQAAQATPEDRALARQGEISTRELKRRSIAATTRRTKTRHESLERDRENAALKGSTQILDWLVSERMARPHTEQVIDEARLRFAFPEQLEGMPSGTAPVGMRTAEIIRRYKPADLESDTTNFMAGYAKWLVSWAISPCLILASGIGRSSLPSASTPKGKVGISKFNRNCRSFPRMGGETSLIALPSTQTTSKKWVKRLN